jgi:hypothetical protein
MKKTLENNIFYRNTTITVVTRNILHQNFTTITVFVFAKTRDYQLRYVLFILDFS